jgi:hypothetical protein
VQDIGFQREESFESDLRGTGMLGPLAILHFVERHPEMLKSVWLRDERDPVSFPLAVIVLNAVAQALKAVEGKRLHSYAAQAGALAKAFFLVSATALLHICGVLMRVSSGR